MTGIGFGFTDIGPIGMQRFISAQTYAMRSSLGTRLGFAVAPINDAPDRAAIQGRIAAAIRDSQADPIGACTAPGESCDFDVAGAAFTETWRALANTQEGVNVQVQLGEDVAVRFDEVGARGATWFSSSATADGPAGWAADGRTYEIATTAITTGQVRVCLGAASRARVPALGCRLARRHLLARLRHDRCTWRVRALRRPDPAPPRASR